MKIGLKNRYVAWSLTEIIVLLFLVGRMSNLFVDWLWFNEWGCREVFSRLPAEKRLEFLLMQPLTPQNRNNMIAWMAARCDEPDYGRLLVIPLDHAYLGESCCWIQERSGLEQVQRD
jgi:uncharacterized membrane protein (UPF0182 family)